MIYYPAALFQDEGQSNWGVIIPDLPGCYPVGDTVADALADAKAAAMFHLEGLLQENLPIPEAQSIEIHRDNPDYADAVLWTMVEADDTTLTGQVRFNVSWPQYLLDRVDEYTAVHHETRSGFLAKAALKLINRS
ncbi:TPA: type II toxin-antitoxin system HicB family antitoxin [Neisseria subflava]